MVKIDKDIPYSEMDSKKYPWSDMDIGDSFVMDKSGHSQACHANIKYSPKKFKCRRQGENAWRVWRVA